MSGNVEPKIEFSKFIGFQNLEAGQRIETLLLLASAKEIVTVFESFGKLLSPAVNDINGNIIKLQKTYDQNPTAFTYLDDLINAAAKDPNNIAISALLWLGRGLELMERFLINVLNDSACGDNLNDCFKKAYQATLEKHHNFIIRETVRFLARMTPTRSILFGTAEKHSTNMKCLELLLPTFRENILGITSMLSKIDQQLLY